MGKHEILKIEDIHIWTDNPRTGTVMNEVAAINTLIEVVGSKKMLNLAIDICQNGLAPNEFPTVVKELGKYNVYDGNRRISCLKVIKKPALIEDEITREKFEQLQAEYTDKMPTELMVYITDQTEALRLMDLAHTGEQDGIGRLAWDAYQRDYSLNKRGLELKYPSAFAIIRILGWTKEKDFNEYPKYTDIERLFGSNLIKSFLYVEDYKNLSQEQINNMVKLMNDFKDYKKEKKFQSFSRHFNETNNSTSGALYNFIQWVNFKNATLSSANPTNDISPIDTTPTAESTPSDTETSIESISLGEIFDITNENGEIEIEQSAIPVLPKSNINVPQLNIYISCKLGFAKKEYNSLLDPKFIKTIYEIEKLSSYNNSKNGYVFSVSLVSLWRTLLEISSKKVLELSTNGAIQIDSNTALEQLVGKVDGEFNRLCPNSNLDKTDPFINSLVTLYSNDNNKDRIKNYITQANGSIHDKGYLLDTDSISKMYASTLTYYLTCLKYIIYKSQPK